MIKEFEGKTEQEAIEMAIEELHIEREDFDVEVVAIYKQLDTMYSIGKTIYGEGTLKVDSERKKIGDIATVSDIEASEGYDFKHDDKGFDTKSVTFVINGVEMSGIAETINFAF